MKLSVFLLSFIDKTSEEPEAGNKLMTQPSASHS